MRRGNTAILYIIGAILILLSCTNGKSQNKNEANDFTGSVPDTSINIPVNYNVSLVKLMDSLQVKQHNISIYIDKSDFIFAVKNKDEVIKEYPIVLGTNPVDDKRMQGDRCTPEGTFHIISKYPHASWKKFIWIDYPNEDSRRKFKEAKANGEIPKDAKIGGEVGIHGTPDDCDYLIDEKVNWTFGCVSLKRKDVDEVYPYIKKETDIVIVK